MSASSTTRRNGQFHFRIRVPADLRSLFIRGELHRSLRTTDPRQARGLARTIRSQAESVFTNIRHRRALGAPAVELESLVRSFYADALPATRTSLIQRQAFGSPSHNSAPQRLREVIDAFATDRSARWEPKTRMMHTASLDLFAQLVGNKLIAAITRQDCRAARDTLCRLPANLTKLHRGIPLHELASRGLEPMSPKTVNRNLSAVSAMFNWCVREGLISDSPARGLLVQIKRRPDLERDAFRPEELKLIFDALAGEAGARFWLTRIALYSGMRLEEIAQLRPQDIREVAGIWCFDVNSDGGKKLKTAGSARLVPIHPQLIEAGLLAYRDANAGKHSLWPDLSRGADGFMSSPFSKWFGRFKRAAGIANPRLTFHSFRHTFVDALKQAGEDELVIKELVGHANASITTGRYGKRLNPGRLFETVSRLRFQIGDVEIDKSTDKH
jgi:integrase